MENEKYFSRSWAMLTSEKGWIKPLLVMAVATLVPVAGALGVSGYAVEWARLTAWGSDTAPKRRDVHVGELIASGWRAFRASALWLLAWFVVIAGVYALFTAIMGRAGLTIAQFLVLVGAFFYMMVVNVAVMRSAIYSEAMAALNPSRVFELVGRDPKGLFKIALIPFVGSLIVGAAVFVMVLVILMFIAGDLMTLVFLAAGSSASRMGANFNMTSFMLGIFLKTIGPALIFGYITSVISAGISLLTLNSVGLWLRQFNVAAWGGPDDPLPPAQPVLPQAGGWNGQAQAAGYRQPMGYQQPAAQPGYQQQVPYQAGYQQQPSGYPQAGYQQPVPAPAPAPAPVPMPAPQQPVPAPASAQQPVSAPAPQQQPAQAPAPQAPDETVQPLILPQDEPSPEAPSADGSQSTGNQNS